ncbi:porin [Paraburkholderia sp. HD33-4]|uniref:porin n=1 Tax=Paraburkholderia sp. HD33-4 TaxID=2883242 RepID=UPI001F399146|nr:porin [Paraburkholderia sp. HD33-4]
MKKTVLLVAALSTFSGVVHAQSSVTLFGIVDTGLVYTSNNGGHSSWQLTSGNESGVEVWLSHSYRSR